MLFDYTVNQFLTWSREPQASALFVGEFIVDSIRIDGKTCFFKHLRIVATKLANVVILSEIALPLFRIGD